MKKILFTLLITLLHQIAVAQVEEKKFSFTLNAVPLEKVIETIEQESGYTFYFDEDWIRNYPEPVTMQLTDVTLETALNTIFQNTALNYYVSDKKIILTKNSVIYDKLPENYFNTDKTKTQDNNTIVIQGVPLFQKELTEQDKKKDAKVNYIGKENKTSKGKTFQLSGYVKEAKTGKPVAEVIIRTKNNEATAITDTQGFYTITLPEGLNIIETDNFLYGKEIRKVVLYNNGKMDLSVSENINQLKEVIVKGKKSETLKSANTGVTSIDVEGMKNIPMVLGERDIFKVATTIPGIKTAGEGSAGFNVRGGKTDQNLVLLDNGVIYNPAHFFGFFSAINPFTIGSADIYKGSIPAEFGGRLASVFDIKTKNGNVTKLSGEGGIGPVTSNLTVSTPIVKEKSSLLVGVRATYSDWILKTLDEKSLQNSEAAFYDGVLKYSHKLNAKNDIEATAYYSHDKFSVSSDSLYKYNNRLFSLKWGHIFNAKHKAALLFSNSQYKFNIEYDKESDITKSFDFGYKINENHLQFKFGYALNDQHKISYGVTTKLYMIEPGYLNPTGQETVLTPVNIDKEKALESGIYLSDAYKVSEKLLISAGIRYSFYAALGSATQRVYDQGAPITDATVVETKEYGNNEIIKTYNGFEPRLSARFFITSRLSVKASYDKTYQYIHLLSSNTTQSPTDTWKLSDLNIAPQDADQFSLGLYKNFTEDDFEVSLEGYIKKTNNLLDYRVGADLLLNENIETELLKGKGKAYGVEFLLKKNSGKLNGWLGYTYSRTFIKLDSEFESDKVNNGEYFPANYDKPHDLSAVLNYKFTKRYSISTNFIYQTGRPITYPVGKYTYANAEYTLYSDRNKFRIPDYYRLDIGVNIEGNHKIKKLAHSFWNISVYNVLGRNNPYSVFFVTKNGEIKAYKTSIFSVPVPTISYNFKF
ncbi:putative outer membrane protein [Flavobacterium limnosediminis JC2902]|uniref:Putative outer membrane protein n=1 Tax=Flavobacterium limnosediminis JC2902 TaxID=1341181 RepID=V6SRW5_9FLAO|nr:TonB-dependent receptor plug domain-containing protein [Flavobacterium limnosediminis]ESU29386.1 putative outer membrane protein [Flavobacterium limnosediminis JC2902]